MSQIQSTEMKTKIIYRIKMEYEQIYVANTTHITTVKTKILLYHYTGSWTLPGGPIAKVSSQCNPRAQRRLFRDDLSLLRMSVHAELDLFYFISMLKPGRIGLPPHSIKLK